MKKLLRLSFLILILLFFTLFSKSSVFAVSTPVCGICPAGTMSSGGPPQYDNSGGGCNLVGSGGTYCSFVVNACTDPVPTLPNCTGITINQIPNTTINGSAYSYLTGSFTDQFLGPYTATVDYGDTTWVKPLTLTGNNFSLNHTYQNVGIYNLTVTVSDTTGMPVSQSSQVTVTDLPPSVGAISVTNPTIPVNTTITANATFSDPGDNNTHTASWNWGDGAYSVGTVTEANGSGSVTDNHTYINPGVYEIILTVTDSNNQSGINTYQFISVYNPSGSFLTGSGTFTSPLGALAQNPSATGDLKFGVDAKYVNDSFTPNGKIKLDLRDANFSFDTTSLQWLVIFGNVAYLQGTGTINNAGNYNILLTTVDGYPTGTPDTIRIQITDSSNKTIYDNEPGSYIYATPTTQITKGSIKIHQ